METKKKSANKIVNYFKTYKDSWLMMLPYLVFFVIFTILPVVVSVVLSFTDYDMVQRPVFVGLENYFQIFLNDEYFIVALKTHWYLPSSSGRPAM